MTNTAPIKRYQDLIVYQKAKLLTVDIIKYFSKIKISYTKDFLFKQLFRAASSIPANLAEGFGRNYSGSFKQFISIARGSAFETEYWLETMFGLGDFDLSVLKDFTERYVEICKMLTSLTNKTKGVTKY